MGTKVRTVVAAGALLGALGAVPSACSHSPTAPSRSVSVKGSVPAVGQTSQLTAKATLSNGTTQDVTAQATWSSSNTATATVTSGGLLKVVALGGATITATYQGANGTFSVNVNACVTISGPVPAVQVAVTVICAPES
jgi:hypothetical protein